MTTSSHLRKNLQSPFLKEDSTTKEYSQFEPTCYNVIIFVELISEAKVRYWLDRTLSESCVSRLSIYILYRIYIVCYTYIHKDDSTQEGPLIQIETLLQVHVYLCVFKLQYTILHTYVKESTFMYISNNSKPELDASKPRNTFILIFQLYLDTHYFYCLYTFDKLRYKSTSINSSKDNEVVLLSHSHQHFMKLNTYESLSINDQARVVVVQKVNCRNVFHFPR